MSAMRLRSSRLQDLARRALALASTLLAQERGAAAVGRPRLGNLGEHALAERVAGSGERVGDVRVQALQLVWRARASDPEVERCAPVHATSVSRELVPESPLLLGRTHERLGEPFVSVSRGAPALDAAGSLDPRDRGDEVPACDVVRRREGLAAIVVRDLLRHGGQAVGTARDNAPERTGRTPEL